MSESRWRGARAAAVVVVLATAATACAGIPDSGVVHVGRPVPAPGGPGDIDVRVLPAAAQAGSSPNDIVHGFLRALVSSDSDYDIARTYLTHRASATWHPGISVTTYDDSGVRIRERVRNNTTRTLELQAPRLGEIDGRGDFTPRGGAVREPYRLVRQSGQWRIDHLSNTVLLSAFDVQRAFRPAVVYYFNQTNTTLVPEQVFLRPTSGPTTALVRALVSGPGAWLAPSVRTAFPAGTSLVGNVPVDSTGTAEVNLTTTVRQASSTQLRAMSAQLVWTLREVGDVTTVRLLADGSPLPVPGVSVNQPITAWPDVNPAAPPPVPIAAFAHRGVWHVVGRQSGVIASASSLTALAVSADGSHIAGIAVGRRAMSLLVGARGGRLDTRVTAQSLQTPAFNPTGTVFVVAVRHRARAVLAVSPTGAVQRVATDAVLTSRPVQRIALSRDGARIAAVVGSPGHGRLLVGRVVARGGGATRFEAFRDVSPGADVRGLAWVGGDQIFTTVADATGGRELVAVDVDGYATRTIPTGGVTGQPVDVAAAPGEPVLVNAGGAIWRSTAAGAWVRVGRGDQPVYPD